jgi:PKD repeat protein
LTNTSTNAPTSWLWDLGNGATSTVQSPSVTYAAAGTYTVALTTTNSAGSSTVTKTITVTAPTGTSAAHISRISPYEASIGTKVTMTGTGFGTAGVVKFGTVTATVWSYTNTSIVVVGCCRLS